ncbi:MCM-domain-containing protein [Neoconidiobolus thromboides FSU 785]|nr:MCM-domain-containing protein [Neoconidiobolus thromboides FSU 785]
MRYFGLNVYITDIISHNDKLAQEMQDDPNEYLKCFEAAVTEAAKKLKINEEYSDEIDLPVRVPQFQVVLKSTSTMQYIRDLNANTIGKLVKITGIVISASSLSSKATSLFIRCKSCGHSKRLPVRAGISGVQIPRKCDNEAKEANQEACPLDPFTIDHDRSLFVDQQTLKLQEAPDMVPVGELPKYLLLSADRCLVNQVVPGTRATVIGIHSAFDSFSKNNNGKQSATRTPYLRLVGLSTDIKGLNRGVISFTDEEISSMEEISRERNLYEKLAKSIAPSIYGSEDIKKAIACLLFGGSLKRLPDGMRLRGDINVLMLGDPSTAKSQLLKFTERVAPISVYTSGKGSSAAGLTASVVRDPSTREFYLEGGAMVLADGGVVCIDEFDKMRDEDRVAIHEAMEQQTISIAKAGITTMLNSRTSVLAAANPIYGRYDDLRTPGENIDFQTTILSRFDMIFIVRDLLDRERDITIAKHVMNIHLNKSIKENNQDGDVFDINKMKRYIAFAKTRCSPRLSPEAADALATNFVELRSTVSKHEAELEQRSPIPITIRQLEAIVRISESLAKMTLSPLATVDHVKEAVRLFQASTMQAIGGDVEANSYQGLGRKDVLEQMQKIDREIRMIVPLGNTTSVQKLKNEIGSIGEYSDIVIDRTINNLVRQEVLQFRNFRKTVFRAKP